MRSARPRPFLGTLEWRDHVTRWGRQMRRAWLSSSAGPGVSAMYVTDGESPPIVTISLYPRPSERLDSGQPKKIDRTMPEGTPEAAIEAAMREMLLSYLTRPPRKSRRRRAVVTVP